MFAWLSYQLADLLVRLLPRRAADRLGIALARLAFAARLPARGHLERNLARLLGRRDGPGLEALARSSFDHFALTFTDFLRLGHGDPARLAGAIEVHGAEHLEAARASGRGVILVSAHLGNWELGAAWLAAQGPRVNLVARPHPSPWVERFYARRRDAWGVRSLPGRSLWSAAAATLGVRLGRGARAPHRRAGAAGGHRAPARPRLRRLLRAPARARGRARRGLRRGPARPPAAPRAAVVRLRGAARGAGVMRVAALVPAYQAAATVGEVILRLQALAAPPEILVVDDGSRDGTAEVARQLGARVHAFAGNRGKGHALLAGFALLRTGFDAVVTLDADGQHPPECLPDFVRAAEAGADLVLGRRARTPDMPASRRFANAFSSGWATGLAGQRVSDSQCGYRLHGRARLERTPLTPGRYEVEPELVVRAA